MQLWITYVVCINLDCCNYNLWIKFFAS
uniref:Uncharacterized protein n=1 Tax=Anguilla anguilla TaxID=7936 RepID=A0A0E9T3Y3_ANGAN